VRSLTWSEVWGQRLWAHALGQPAARDQLVDLVGSVCGIHAQVMSSAELALGVRVDGLEQHHVRDALWTARSLVKTYGLRGTLHLFPSREIGLWLSALRAKPPPRAGNERLASASVERIVHAIADALDHQQLTRAELADELRRRLGGWAADEVLPAFGGRMPLWQLALGSAALESVLAFGPPRGNQVTYVRLDQWIDTLHAVDGRQALRQVAHRYVAAYGPTTPKELARWLSTTPKAAREVLAELDDLEEVDVEGWHALAIKTWHRPDSRAQVHLLPQFDPYVVGCFPREQLIAPPDLRTLGTAAPYAVVLVDGVVSGLWQRHNRGKRIAIRVDVERALTKAHERALAANVDRLSVFLGKEIELERGHIEPRAHL
jgi:winged helix DNA-binding protein